MPGPTTALKVAGSQSSRIWTILLELAADEAVAGTNASSAVIPNAQSSRLNIPPPFPHRDLVATVSQDPVLLTFHGPGTVIPPPTTLSESHELRGRAASYGQLNRILSKEKLRPLALVPI